MSTVIIGGGIIGHSTAYYLSLASKTHRHQIHIIDPATDLFDCASGYAAGFIVRDWYSPELAALGNLSFELHEQLSREHSGYEKWGYMRGTAVGLQAQYEDGQRSGSGHDWLRQGASRAEVAMRADEKRAGEPDEAPEWLTRQEGGRTERISDVGGTAQVDPLRLCQFLLAKCIERGVQVHNPARAIALIRNSSSGAITGITLQNRLTNTCSTIPCTNLIFTAGAWTPHAFNALFPTSLTRIPVTSLSGYSILVRSPRHTIAHERGTYAGTAHAVFTTHPRSCGFSPEIFSRAGGEIYLAGLNSAEMPLPALASEARGMMEAGDVARVRKAAVTLMGKLDPDAKARYAEGDANIDDLEVLREALCFRPWTESGRPIVTRVGDWVLGSGVVSPPGGGVFMATGHGPWGISLSLGTGKVMAEMVMGVKTSADVSGLGLEEGMGTTKAKI
ncbi:FAD dependent oxidoreductase superfamily [Histoplasma capsulatum var. duboisii H88]|uniref:FAD dependent oxidoreductase superfamily n=1 Tax=Ajellomyces capsulatus (strain H88) TaxID=544711 RepID=A0A8A1LSF6_AJEC8|nr:FAD dependent oxidoreductase superfamily [Histoplasma capsulatum var. duboisii H88]